MPSDDGNLTCEKIVFADTGYYSISACKGSEVS